MKLRALFLTLFCLAAASPARAIPVFAHRYNLTCQACHMEVPHLTTFGQTFLANGYRIPGVKPGRAFPVAVRVESSYASAGAADPDDSTTGPLPKAIVDEIEFLTGGSIGKRGSYWAEVYAVDGGVPGRPRDIWSAYRATPDGAKVPVVLRAGQFTLPLPLDPETFRETTEPYAIWSQTAGADPFDFFIPKIGGQIIAGDPGRGVSGSYSILQAHEPGSGLPVDGLDTMATLERDFGPLALTAYRYDGSRSLRGLGYGGTFAVSGVADRFWRNGFGVGWKDARTEANLVYQNGNDSSSDFYNDALQTSGGFVQARRTLGARTFALARWDATRDAAFARTVTAGLGYDPARNMRLTLFETGQRDYTGRLLHIISSSFLFAY